MSSNSWKVCEVECAAGFRIIPEGSERAVAIAIQRDPNAHGLDGISADEALHHARLIAAAPELLAIVTRELRNGEQSHFEDWLERTCPSGDVEAVERQWVGSADYALFADEYREELAVLAKIEGRA